jgi:hypothetical protein
MRKFFETGCLITEWCARLIFITGILIAPLKAQQLSLQAVVTPSTVILKDGSAVVSLH